MLSLKLVLENVKNSDINYLKFSEQNRDIQFSIQMKNYLSSSAWELRGISKNLENG